MPDTDTDRAPVTVLGLGLMGQALAGAFLAAGHPTTVWNRTPSKANQLVARGATPAPSPREAVAASSLVVVCVTDNQAVRELLEPLGNALVGRVVVNFTSGTSQQARTTAAQAARDGATYLDGVILAIPSGIGTTDATILCSGPRSAFETHVSTLRSLSPGVVHVGTDHGLAALYDMAMLSVMWGLVNGFLHATALMETAEVGAATVVPVVHGGIAVVGKWISDYADQIDAGEYPPDDATIGTQRAAMQHLFQESAAAGINSDLPAFVLAMADRAVADGRGGDSYAAIIEQFRKPAKSGHDRRRNQPALLAQRPAP
jgi:3-hydroxyisobutyrate dehydrogenase-like beta-hydroxyacid dehydrogenase